MNDATVLGKPEATPKPGDFCICLYCGSWLRYTDADLATRKFEAEDILDLTDEQRELMRRATHLIRTRAYDG